MYIMHHTEHFGEITSMEIIALEDKSVSNKSHCCALYPRSPLRLGLLVNQAIVGVCRAADNGSLSLHQCRRPGLASATRSPSLFTENKSIFSARVFFGKPHTTALQDCNSRYVWVQMGTFRRTCVCFDFIFIPVSLWTGVCFLWSRQLRKTPLYLIWNNDYEYFLLNCLIQNT